jgi:hypothetical protein
VTDSPGRAKWLARVREFRQTRATVFLRLRFIALSLAATLVASCIRIPEPTEVKRVPVRSDSPVVKSSVPAPHREPDVRVWLLADGLHTGMVFPCDWLVESGFRLPEGFGRSKYVTLSWGNQVAYLQQEWLTLGQAMRALFTPSPSTMELIPFDYDVAEVCHYQRIWTKLVPRERGPEVAAFLNGCVRHDAKGEPVVIGKSSWGKGVLLDSPHRYFLPRICNIWTLQAMEACGCRIRPWMGLTADGVARQAEKRRNGFEKVWDGYPLEKPAGN